MRLKTVLSVKLLCLGLLVVFLNSMDAQSTWTTSSLTFRPEGITTNGTTFWSYGSHDGIASSSDGYEWTGHVVAGATDSLLLGLSFPTSMFGFGYGTAGTLVFTTDSGQTWLEKNVGTDTILAASFADPNHGILRTAGSVFVYINGLLRKVILPKQVPSDFKYVPSVAALSPERMAFSVSEGWRSRMGFVYTVDRGENWAFYEPPHIVAYQILRGDDNYWMVGNETVDYDKPGGGYGVPAILRSADGSTWQHTRADVRPCHWEGCHSCNVSGCLASSNLLIRPFETTATLSGIPSGALTANWAATKDRICTVSANVQCAMLGPPEDVSKPGPPAPQQRQLPVLGEPKGKGLLRCILCSLDPVFVDKSASGTYKIHLKLVVGVDGVPTDVALENVPSASVQEKLADEVHNWLFEAPTQNGKAIRVSTATDLTIQVIRAK